MTDVDFPEELQLFIETCLPTVDAMELLLLLSRHRERLWRPENLMNELQPDTVIKLSALREYLTFFKERGLITETREGRYQLGPLSEETETVVKMLTTAYNTRPVTLIRMVYSLADRKISLFADAFKFKKE